MMNAKLQYENDLFLQEKKGYQLVLGRINSQDLAMIKEQWEIKKETRKTT